MRWWSRWARLRWHGEGYLLTSDGLKEPFFNRAGALACRAVAGALPWAERILRATGADSTFMLFEGCASARRLMESGYRKTDTMAVLAALPSKDKGEEGGVRVAKDPDTWVSAYLRSFYGDEELAGAVLPVVSSIGHSRASTLLESREGGETTGVLALHRTPGILGAYCVGTVPEFRKRGVATALLARAGKIASEEGRTLLLQTLASDGALPFYQHRGFQLMHSKLVLVRRLK